MTQSEHTPPATPEEGAIQTLPDGLQLIIDDLQGGNGENRRGLRLMAKALEKGWIKLWQFPQKFLDLLPSAIAGAVVQAQKIGDTKTLLAASKLATAMMRQNVDLTIALADVTRDVGPTVSVNIGLEGFSREEIARAVVDVEAMEIRHTVTADHDGGNGNRKHGMKNGNGRHTD